VGSLLGLSLRLDGSASCPAGQDLVSDRRPSSPLHRVPAGGQPTVRFWSGCRRDSRSSWRVTVS